MFSFYQEVGITRFILRATTSSYIGPGCVTTKVAKEIIPLICLSVKLFELGSGLFNFISCKSVEALFITAFVGH